MPAARTANQLPQQIESLIVRLKAAKPHWGARKIRALLVRRRDGDVKVPAKSTFHAVLDRHGLVKRSGGPRHRARGTPLSEGAAPNELWCADFKGEFKLGNGRYCTPLTVTDHASRLLLLCEALDSRREELAVTAFERLFRERGSACYPLRQWRALRQSQCLVQSLKAVGLVAPARHRDRTHQAGPAATERPPRAHAPLKKEATPPGFNSLQQQGRFEAFVFEFHTEPPHQALDMKCPADVDTPSSRPYLGLPELTYPFHDRDILVTACGRLCLNRNRINVSTVLAGQRLGIKEVRHQGR